MRIFKELDGIRGWLAWIVVFSHIANQTGLLARYPALLNLQLLGDVAVRVFIILSGFVIYHLIVEKHESFPAYIARRFMRIYPVYVVCLAAGIVVTLATVATPLPQAWQAMPFADRLIQEVNAAPGALFFANVLAHLGMVHGAIPNNVLFESEYFFLPPAWSLSLEWQFYLVAPLVVWLLSRPYGREIAAVTITALAFAYNRGYFGQFALPSFLPGAVFLFAIGIVSRMMLPKLIGLFPFAPAVVLVLAGMVVVQDKANLHLPIWAALFCYLVAHGQPATPSTRFLSTALESKAALWFGKRSYPTYLVHVPVVQALVLIAGHAGLSYWTMVFTVSLASVALVIISSDLLHRFVEKPGIKLGVTGAAMLQARSSKPVPTPA